MKFLKTEILFFASFSSFEINVSRVFVPACSSGTLSLSCLFERPCFPISASEQQAEYPGFSAPDRQRYPFTSFLYCTFLFTCQVRSQLTYFLSLSVVEDSDQKQYWPRCLPLTGSYCNLRAPSAFACIPEPTVIILVKQQKPRTTRIMCQPFRECIYSHMREACSRVRKEEFVYTSITFMIPVILYVTSSTTSCEMFGCYVFLFIFSEGQKAFYEISLRR